MNEIKVGKVNIPVIKGEKGDKGDRGLKGDTGAKGDNGIDGLNGIDGYTPIKGTDYWTENDKNEIFAEIDNKINEDLVDYYTKEQTYNKEEVDNKISAIPKFDKKVVTTLPTINISETTVYLVPSGSDSNDMYREYIYVEGKWELIGIQKSDLSNIYTKTEIDSMLEERDAKITTAETKISEVEAQIGDISSILDTINGEVI